MRWGLEQSRNLMTVRAANQVGMDRVIRSGPQHGVGDYAHALPSISLAPATPRSGTQRFSTFANHGRSIGPTLIDYVQDRNGKVIFRSDDRCTRMTSCNAPNGTAAHARPPVRGRQVVDPLTAYQVVHMLEGVVSAAPPPSCARSSGRSSARPAPPRVPRSLVRGRVAGGRRRAVSGLRPAPRHGRPRAGRHRRGADLPQFAKAAFEGMQVVPFRAPAGIRMVRIDRRSGRRVQGSWPTDDPRAAIIWEAFKPESEPRRSFGSDEAQIAEAAPQQQQQRRRRRSAPRPAAAPAAAPVAEPLPSPGVAN
jgi:penicillin-binding protein 1A